ncbi:MAG: DUF308 domain-containing protein [Lachnospiraceae bacterium]|nr:DUF308 domain-containing protein [Lachnospiraceae bacterium]
MKLVCAAKVGYIFASIANMLIGLVMLLCPEISIGILCRIIGIILLLSGAVKLFGYFTNDLYRLAFQYDLALGIITMLPGVFMIIAPGLFSKVLVFAAAIYVIVNAVFTIQTAVEAKRFGIKKWWLLLMGAILSGLIGILLILRPYKSAIAVTRLMGIAFITDGLQNLLVAILTIRIQEDHQI